MILLGVNLILGALWFWGILKTMTHILETEPTEVKNKIISTIFLTWILVMIPTIIATSGIAIIIKHF